MADETKTKDSILQDLQNIHDGSFMKGHKQAQAFVGGVINAIKNNEDKAAVDAAFDKSITGLDKMFGADARRNAGADKISADMKGLRKNFDGVTPDKMPAQSAQQNAPKPEAKIPGGVLQDLQNIHDGSFMKGHKQAQAFVGGVINAIKNNEDKAAVDAAFDKSITGLDKMFGADARRNAGADKISADMKGLRKNFDGVTPDKMPPQNTQQPATPKPQTTQQLQSGSSGNPNAPVPLTRQQATAVNEALSEAGTALDSISQRLAGVPGEASANRFLKLAADANDKVLTDDGKGNYAFNPQEYRNLALHISAAQGAIDTLSAQAPKEVTPAQVQKNKATQQLLNQQRQQQPARGGRRGGGPTLFQRPNPVPNVNPANDLAARAHENDVILPRADLDAAENIAGNALNKITQVNVPAADQKATEGELKASYMYGAVEALNHFDPKTGLGNLTAQEINNPQLPPPMETRRNGKGGRVTPPVRHPAGKDTAYNSSVKMALDDINEVLANGGYADKDLKGDLAKRLSIIRDSATTELDALKKMNDATRVKLEKPVVDGIASEIGELIPRANSLSLPPGTDKNSGR